MRNSHSKESMRCLKCGVFLPLLRKMWWFLQNCTDSENIVVDPYSAMYPASHDADQAMNVKLKEGSDVEVEDDPVPISFPEIKAEPELSCMCTVRQITQMCRSAGCLSDFHLCLCTWNNFTVLLTGFLRPFPEISLGNCSLLNVACDVPLPFAFKQI
jgi:hypothetical protein